MLSPSIDYKSTLSANSRSHLLLRSLFFTVKFTNSIKSHVCSVLLFQQMSAVFTDVDAIIGKLFEMNNSNTVLEND